MNIAAWLLSMVAPLVIRGLVALGFTAVSYAGAETLMNQLISMAQTSWNAVPASVLQLASLSGIPDALGITLGAYAARFSVWIAVSGSKYVLSK